MQKLAIVLLADTNSEEGFGRAYNAMNAVKMLSEGGNDVRLYFDGTGTRWPAILSEPSHMAHGLYTAVYEKIEGACNACATAFGAKGSITPLNEKAEDEVDYQKIMADGYQVITF